MATIMRILFLVVAFCVVTCDAFGQAPERKSPLGVTDDDLLKLPLSTTELRLRGNRGYGNDVVTDAGIKHLTRLANLRSLKAGALGLTDEACESIGQMTQLEELELDSNKITGKGLKSLTTLKRLKKLNLNFNPFEEDDLAVLQELSELRDLRIATMNAIGDKTFLHCSKLPKLERMDWSYENPNVTDQGLKYLSALTELRHVRLNNAQVTNEGLAELSKLKKLDTLALRNLRSVKPGAFGFVTKMDALKDIEINLVQLDESDLQHIVSRKNLERLMLWSVFSDNKQTIASLGRPEHLVALRTNIPLDRAAIDELKYAANLQSITDGVSNLDDESVAMLSELKQLDTLYIDSPQITSKSLQSLAKMQSLRTLMVTKRVPIDANELSALGRDHLTKCLIQQLDAPFTIFYKPPTE